MENNIQTKVNRLGRIGLIVVIVMIVSTVVTGVLRIAETVRILPMLNDPVIRPGLYLIERIISVVMGLVLCVFELWVVNGFRRCDSPFEDGVIRRLNVCAWVCLVIAVLNSLMNVPLIVAMFREHNTLNAWIGVGSLLPSFTLVFALFMLFLVRIFRYGAQLQKEADETL